MNDITEELEAFNQSLKDKGLGAILNKNGTMISIRSTTPCPICGKEFPRTRTDQIYCNRKCSDVKRQRAFRVRRKLAVTNA